MLIFFFKIFSSISKLFLSTSTNTGFAPASFTAFAAAGKVIFGMITSSSFSMPIAFKAKKIEIVPLVVVTTYLTLRSLESFFSNNLANLPSFGKLVFKTFFINVTVPLLSITGSAKRILFFIIIFDF